MFRNRTVGTQFPRKLPRSVAILRFEGQKRATVGWHLIGFTLRLIQEHLEERFGQTDLLSRSVPFLRFSKPPEHSLREDPRSSTVVVSLWLLNAKKAVPEGTAFLH